ncbi:signal peptidase I [Lactobacillus colini]|uniref:Signal peptidase I n=1 Tax=Lactobacillus colini TaxID=1819254 RepID=A0ABS4MEC5_9LACO|nr:signal peptidase I [Lactobacillus colini]MBP2058038.1 signal peptidase I [Lactobacillus colini]
MEKKDSLLKDILQVVVIVVAIWAVFGIVFKFFLSNDTVSGTSMQPTFESGDRVIALRNSKLQRGDIVILKAPDEPGALYIKRVIGTPGDSLKYQNDKLYINGKEVKEPYLTKGKKEFNSKGQLYTENFSLQSKHLGKSVPKDSYFVMGDHRNVSKDSRYFGYVKKSAIIGKVIWRYWPLNSMKTF